MESRKHFPTDNYMWPVDIGADPHDQRCSRVMQDPTSVIYGGSKKASLSLATSRLPLTAQATYSHTTLLLKAYFFTGPDFHTKQEKRARIKMATTVNPSWDDILLDNMYATSMRGVTTTTITPDFTFDPPSVGASSLFHVWKKEGEEEAKLNGNNDHDDDVIMQLDEDEGLLDLNDFYDSISAADDDMIPPPPPEQQLLVDVVLPMDSSDSDTNSFFSCENEDDDIHYLQQQQQLPSSREFQETMEKLTQSMQKSQATRKSLYAQTPKLKDYQRSGTVESVVRQIEYSSQQIDTYYSSIRTML
eukprot:scaffold12877_cov84-Cylindrotheca_fusiformis.AAC.5